METILIATNFTAAAENATRYGFQLSAHMKARVVLLNCCRSSDKMISTNGNLQTRTEQLKEAAKRHNTSGEVWVETVSRQGSVSAAIRDVAEEYKASLIVVGMKDERKKIRKIFGSTIVSLLSNAFVPLIVVPEKATVSIPNKILLNANLCNETSIGLVRQLKRITEACNARLTISQVVDSVVSEPLELLMKCSKPDWYLRALRPEYEFLPQTVEGKALVNFVVENKFDMLAVVSHPPTWFEKTFKGSSSEHLATNTVVPLLILPSVDAIEPATDKNASTYCSGKCLQNNQGIPQCSRYGQMQLEYEEELSA